MKKRNPFRTSWIVTLAILVAISMSGAVAAVSQPAQSVAIDLAGAEYVPDELIVTFRANATALDRANIHAQAALEKIKDLPLAGKELVRIKDGRTVADAIARLQANPKVKAVQPNFIYQADDVMPNDPSFPQLWGLHNTGQTITYPGVEDCDIDAPAAWDTTMGSPSIIVAVIDEGIDITHPDLAANIWVNTAEKNGITGVDDDGNGFVDDVNGWNFYGDNNIVYSSKDGDDHGTHCAGTIAAVGNNGIGVIGVAPNVKVMPLKFLGRRGGSTADAIDALGYAKLMGAHLASNSWGGGAYDPSLYEAIRSFAKPFVAAAGNSGEDADETPHYPSSYDLDNIISIAAVNNRALLSSFSNYGATSVDIGAPGESILSTLPVAQGSYGTYSGTSMATPHVSGIVALMLSVDSTLTGTGVRQLLINTAVDLPSLDGKTVSGGMANAAAALAALGPVTPNDPPSVAISGPADGASFEEGASIAFSATASDTEDGDLTGSIAWTSSVDGAIGTGGSFSKVLSVGIHVITASVTDSKGQTASDSVTVTVNDTTPDQIISVASVTGASSKINPATWQAIVTVTVDPALAGAVVTGTWSTGLAGSATTGSDGKCTIQATFNKKVPSVTFKVTGITLSGYTFDGAEVTSDPITKP